ncbi:hypothetical protein Tco_0645143, partial [Tanacetum coccineum]
VLSNEQQQLAASKERAAEKLEEIQVQVEKAGNGK